MRTTSIAARSEATPTRGAVLVLILRSTAAKIGNWRRMRRAERELLALDDRYLKDMGISRSDIPNAVRGLQRRMQNPTCGLAWLAGPRWRVRS